MDPGSAQDTDFHGYGASIRESLSELIPADEDIQILDIGTGMAATSRFLLQRLSKGSRIWSLDPSEDVIANARTALAVEHRQKRIEFVQGSADDLKFEDDSFDIVVSVMVMHHIGAIGGSIAEMSRVLKEGGRLIVVDYSPDAHTLDFKSRHLREDFFTSRSISEAAKAANLRPRVEDQDKWYLVEATKTREGGTSPSNEGTSTTTQRTKKGEPTSMRAPIAGWTSRWS